MYTLIEHKKLDAAAASITFSNIPQTYTDLYLLVSARSDGTGNNYTGLGINGVNTNQTSRFLYGTGSGTGSVSLTGASDYNAIAYMPISTTTSNTFSSASFYIPNYTSNVAKSISIDAVAENNATAGQQEIMAALWNSTAAITSLTVASVAGSSLQASGNMVSGSSATLYGINRKTAIGKPKAIGGNITYANGYWVHTFTGSGTFTTQQAISDVEYLVIAGGGGGGTRGGVVYGSGGGAGGYRTTTGISGGGASAEARLSLAAGTYYAVTVGAGGAASSQGSDSIFGPITSIGGGRGITNSYTTGIVGGSGSGGGNGNGVGGSGTAGQGYAGGRGSDNTFSTNTGMGGGGGAGGIGGLSSGNAPGIGGVGVQSSITGATNWYAAGGGGAAYYSSPMTNGIGGGTQGTGTPPVSINGAVGTGSGGGGGNQNGYEGQGDGIGGSGGSGVVVIRYRAD